MVYTMRDFRRDYVREHLAELMPGELLAALPAEGRRAMLQAATPEERLAGLSAEQILATLTAEQIRDYLDRKAAEGKSRSRRPRRKK